MKTQICRKEFLDSMVSMPSSSEAQNQSLSNEIAEGLSLEHCFIKIKDDKVVCRIVVFEELKYLGYFTVEDIAQEEIDEFLLDVIAQLDTSIEWCTDLYTDKIHYEKIYRALCQNSSLRIDRESYTVDTSSQDISSYDFSNISDINTEEILELMMKASSSTLDIMIQRDQERSGVLKAMEIMLHELLSKQKNDALFQVLWIDEKAVGFVVVNELIEGVGGIGYIGVIPEAQGFHYSSVLLQKAKDISFHHHIYKLIADIDVHNFAIRKNLIDTGFEKDCEQKILILKR